MTGAILASKTPSDLGGHEQHHRGSEILAEFRRGHGKVDSYLATVPDWPGECHHALVVLRRIRNVDWGAWRRRR